MNNQIVWQFRRNPDNPYRFCRYIQWPGRPQDGGNTWANVVPGGCMCFGT
ncbi:MAG: hypothetical protein IPP46_18220 [Bacteroidetes bacterium]|nr:hypothetical protein [Bacteroidota bacterium]